MAKKRYVACIEFNHRISLFKLLARYLACTNEPFRVELDLALNRVLHALGGLGGVW